VKALGFLKIFGTVCQRKKHIPEGLNLLSKSVSFFSQSLISYHHLSAAKSPLAVTYP
jgi:hypothetical protein